MDAAATTHGCSAHLPTLASSGRALTKCLATASSPTHGEAAPALHPHDKKLSLDRGDTASAASSSHSTSCAAGAAPRAPSLPAVARRRMWSPGYPC